MKNIILSIVLFLTLQMGIGQANYIEEDLKIDQFTEGTLTTPSEEKAKSLVVFIQGSGPTDRDGNQPMMNNDGMKKLARELADKGIASFRFDKRIFKMTELQIKEKDLRFDDFVTDVNSIIEYFKNDDRFENLVLAGHSEGSLIGMLAAGENVDAFISLAGAGRPIDDVIVEQVANTNPAMGEKVRAGFDELMENGQTENYQNVEFVLRPSVQPYMKSWIQYDPAEEISKLEIPILIINGTFDIQVAEKEAELLKEANPEAELVLLDKMNHIFRKIESQDRLVNTKSYNEPNQALHPELVPVITKFVKELE
ncbi:alpha/beta hydrolase [Gramella sp. GC03-9]|uniref:Alpha/beta hydrolase n=1 Tax=Christiangramia oceanisediminis TaxID=2920386 RepID=A0A9X2KZH5_9FLAO|nr:alpha/beta hydrolase [Gramella oceanisediminis]MCP9201150.1 alpha/beta hydrolase [Gramella oceanisediminis]